MSVDQQGIKLKGKHPLFEKVKIVIKTKNKEGDKKDLYLLSQNNHSGWTKNIDDAYNFSNEEKATQIALKVSQEFKACYVQKFNIVYDCFEEIRFSEKTERTPSPFI